MDDRPQTRDLANAEPPPHDVLRIGSKARAPQKPADRSPAPEDPPASAPAKPAEEGRAPATEPRRDPPPAQRDMAPAARATADRRPGLLRRIFGGTVKLIFTAVVLIAAAIAAVVIWDYYVTSPWTRDGRVRVQVASIAPQVSGQITEVRVLDNQFVHKGDVLYVIDPFDFKNAVDQAKTQVQMKAADLQVKSVQAERRQKLSNLATTAEEQQQYVGNAVQAQAAFKSAQVQEALAEINLDRTKVMSPVNGFITNLQLRVGDYARSGTTNISVIDADSYWVDGYFEETKMAHVCVGDRVEAKLMGYRTPILGVVDTVTRGIAVSDAASSTQGLPSVDPVYTWVRLAQRVPVRIRITDVPPGVPLVSGMTATVTVHDPALDAEGPWWQQRYDGLRERLVTIMDRPAPQPNCVPTIGDLRGRIVTIPSPEPTPARTPNQINPGLTPGMNVSPAAPK